MNRWLQAGQYDKARAAAADYRDIFGPGNFYGELMDHGIDIERRTRADLLKIAKELDLPLVATNDLHYTYPEDAEAHEVLLCVQTGKTLADPNRFKFDADDFYLKTPAEMRDVWRGAARGLRQHAGDRRALRGRVHRGPRPDAALPGAGGGDRGVLAGQGGRARACAPGSRQGVPRAAAQAGGVRGRRHLADGFPGYFLVVADLVRYAKDNGHPGRPRARLGGRVR